MFTEFYKQIIRTAERSASSFSNRLRFDGTDPLLTIFLNSMKSQLVRQPGLTMLIRVEMLMALFLRHFTSESDAAPSEAFISFLVDSIDPSFKFMQRHLQAHTALPGVAAGSRKFELVELSKTVM